MLLVRLVEESLRGLLHDIVMQLDHVIENPFNPRVGLLRHYFSHSADELDVFPYSRVGVVVLRRSEWDYD